MPARQAQRGLETYYTCTLQILLRWQKSAAHLELTGLRRGLTVQISSRNTHALIILQNTFVARAFHALREPVISRWLQTGWKETLLHQTQAASPFSDQVFHRISKESHSRPTMPAIMYMRKHCSALLERLCVQARATIRLMWQSLMLLLNWDLLT